MKLCIEAKAKLAAAVAVVSMALTTGAMAQGHRSGASHFGQTSNPVVNTHMSQQPDKPTVSDEKVTSSGREQRVDRQGAREQREDRRDARQQRGARQEAVRQREERFQSKNKKDKSPFDGSILEVKPSS
jgi:hypothetical protein